MIVAAFAPAAGRPRRSGPPYADVGGSCRRAGSVDDPTAVINRSKVCGAAGWCQPRRGREPGHEHACGQNPCRRQTHGCGYSTRQEILAAA